MRVLVTGGRDYHNINDARVIYATLDAIHGENEITALIHGDAHGADRLAAAWAYDNKVDEEAYPADWARYGKAAGPIRNQSMVDAKPDLVVAFPGRRGTADCVRRAKLAGIPVRFA